MYQLYTGASVPENFSMKYPITRVGELVGEARLRGTEDMSPAEEAGIGIILTPNGQVFHVALLVPHPT